MITTLMSFSIVAPTVAGLIALAASRVRLVRDAAALLGAIVALAIAWRLHGVTASVTLPWMAPAMELALRLTPLASLMLLASAGLTLVVFTYSLPLLHRQSNAGLFYFLALFSLSLLNGVVLAADLLPMLFFWEGLLIAMFGMIAIGRPGAWRVALKALIIMGVADVILTFGVELVEHLHHEQPMALSGLGALAFACLIIGAAAKLSVLPFQSWVAEAATEAPLPFMALFQAAFQKLAGFYLLWWTYRLFDISHCVVASRILLLLGAITLLDPIPLALATSERKRAAAYVSISASGLILFSFGAQSHILWTMTIISVVVSCSFYLVAELLEQRQLSSGKTSAVGFRLPLLSSFANATGSEWLDFYDLLTKLARGISAVVWGIDRFVCWLTDGLAAGLASMFSFLVRTLHNGSLSIYIWWAVAGVALVIGFLVKAI